MNESSGVKALVRSASNLSGRSIKRKLQRRNPPTLIALGSILWVSNQSRSDEDYYRWRRNKAGYPGHPFRVVALILLPALAVYGKRCALEDRVPGLRAARLAPVLNVCVVYGGARNLVRIFGWNVVGPRF